MSETLKGLHNFLIQETESVRCLLIYSLLIVSQVTHCHGSVSNVIFVHTSYLLLFLEAVYGNMHIIFSI